MPSRFFKTAHYYPGIPLEHLWIEESINELQEDDDQGFPRFNGQWELQPGEIQRILPVIFCAFGTETDDEELGVPLFSSKIKWFTWSSRWWCTCHHSHDYLIEARLE